MPNFRKFVGVVKAGRMSHTDIHTDIHTYRGYFIGPFPSGGPKNDLNKLGAFAVTSSSTMTNQASATSYQRWV